MAFSKKKLAHTDNSESSFLLILSILLGNLVCQWL